MTERRIYERVFTMPNKETFSIPIVRLLIKTYLSQSQLSIDTFARNKEWATITNDLNPDTNAQYHMDVLEFLVMLKEQGIKPDLVLFDPPYSPTQMKRAYDDIGRKMNREDSWRSAGWQKERNAIDEILQIGGIVISLDWNSAGMGMKRPYEFVKGLLLYHGGGRNDTIITVERKVAHQNSLF
jgi:hypothetical protein